MKSKTEYERIMELIGNNPGHKFESDEDARKYFRVKNIEKMFGECRLSQCDLDALCESVIEEKDVWYADLWETSDPE